MGCFQGKNGKKWYFWVILGAKIWIKIRKPRDRFQEKLIKIRDPENLVGSRPLRGGFIFNTPVTRCCRYFFLWKKKKKKKKVINSQFIKGFFFRLYKKLKILNLSKDFLFAFIKSDCFDVRLFILAT